MPLYHDCKFDKNGQLLIQKHQDTKFILQVCPRHGTRENDQKYCGDWCPLLEECFDGNDFLYLHCGTNFDRKLKIIEDLRNV